MYITTAEARRQGVIGVWSHPHSFSGQVGEAGLACLLWLWGAMHEAGAFLRQTEMQSRLDRSPPLSKIAS